MADEIKVSAKLAFVKSGRGASLGIVERTFDFTGTDYTRKTQQVGTTEEALVLGEVAAGGWCIIINRDATNFVAVKSATAVTPLIRINAGEAALFRLHGSATVPFVQADTAAVEIEVLLLEA